MRVFKHLLAVLALLVGGQALAQPTIRLAHEQAVPPAELAAFVDGVAETAMARDHVAGVTISIVQNGQIVFKRGYGIAGLNPRRSVDADSTLFRLGSISKTFTWITLLKQVEMGRMDLMSPVDTYLPLGLHTGKGKIGAQIRLIDLMDHSPGFEDKIFGTIFEQEPAKVRALDQYLMQARPARVRAPGLVTSYSNYGAALAGSAAAHTAGMEFESLAEDTIINPLKMTHTTFREPRPAHVGLPAPMSAALAADASAGFQWTGTDYKARGYEYIGQIAPAGAVSSTAADMARYMLMILGGGTLEGAQIYGPQTALALKTPVRPMPPGLNWRHGFYEQPLPGGIMGFGHNGGTVSFFSNMTLIPDLNMGVFVSTNTDTGGRLQAAIAPAIVGHFYAPEQPFPPKADPRVATMADAFSGHYLSTRRARGGLEGFVHRLVFGADVAVTPDGHLVISDPQGARAYVSEGDPRLGRFIATDSRNPLVFEMKDGRATGILAGGATLVRTGPFDAPGPLLFAALATVIASITGFVGLAFRPRTAPSGPRQAWASRIQLVQSAVWIMATLAMGVLMATATDQSKVMYNWPNPAIVTASALSLIAGLITLATLFLLPSVWREVPWSKVRKVGFIATALFSVILIGFLLHWGFLAPWNP